MPFKFKMVGPDGSDRGEFHTAAPLAGAVTLRLSAVARQWPDRTSDLKRLESDPRCRRRCATGRKMTQWARHA
jgi:hypothetical protein